VDFFADEMGKMPMQYYKLKKTHMFR